MLTTNVKISMNARKIQLLVLVVLVVRIPKDPTNAFARWDLNMSKARAVRTLTNVKIMILGQHVALVNALILPVVMHVNVNLDMSIKEWLSAINST